MTGIDHSDWNATIADLWRKLHPAVTVVDGGGFVHPWQTGAAFDPVERQWVATVAPGFVYGTPAALNSSFILPPSSFRNIGPDAAPVGIASAGGAAGALEYEPVPPFFSALGVGPVPRVTFSESGINTDAVSGGARVLRACDLVLYQPRAFTVPDASAGADLRGGVSVSFPADAVPRIEARARFVPPVAGPDDLPLPDVPHTAALVATVFLVSPGVDSFGAVPDARWTPYVKQSLFWNLAFATKQRLAALRQDNLTFIRGLAAGAGDNVIQGMLDDVNKQTRELAAFLSDRKIEGAFWTV